MNEWGNNFISGAKRGALPQGGFATPLSVCQLHLLNAHFHEIMAAKPFFFFLQKPLVAENSFINLVRCSLANW